MPPVICHAGLGVQIIKRRDSQLSPDTGETDADAAPGSAAQCRDIEFLSDVVVNLWTDLNTLSAAVTLAATPIN